MWTGLNEKTMDLIQQVEEVQSSLPVQADEISVKPILSPVTKYCLPGKLSVRQSFVIKDP